MLSAASTRDGDEGRGAEGRHGPEHDEQGREGSDLRDGGEEGGDGGGRTGVGRRRPGVERHERELEAEAGEEQHDPERQHARRDRGPGDDGRRRRRRGEHRRSCAPPDDRAASGVRNGLPVAANHSATPSTSRAKETSDVTSSWVAPATADRRPDRATRAMTGRVASSRATSQVPTSRLAATTTVPVRAARSSTASTGSLVASAARRRAARGQASAMQTRGREGGGELERRRERVGLPEAGLRAGPSTTGAAGPPRRPAAG